ncbi:MAG: hypothetical protein J6A01_01250 [Proteobacteria bacterium]|nr:hypothetical protein [Pseudomonadota bacterium]
MKKRLSISVLVLLGLLGFAGCDDGNSSATSVTPEPEAKLCEPACTTGETCVEGVCQCGSEVCKAEETCESGKCVPKTEPCTGEQCGVPEPCTGEHCGVPEPCTGDDCEPPVDSCNGACSESETCVEGVCKCGDDVCGSDETCKDGQCEKPAGECTGDDCEPPVDSCNGACSEAETCVDGVCKCGDEVCQADETCKEGTCEKSAGECTGDDCEPPVDSCNGACSEAETCVDGVCKCGDNTCTEHQVCKDGACVDKEDEHTGEEEGPTCEPACNENEKCEESGCVPIETPTECSPACDAETEYCDENGACQKIEEESCTGCSDEETCVSGVCMCGKSTCNEDEYCKAGKCEPIDPCAKKTCSAGEVCVDGDCKAMPVSFKPTKLDVMLSSVSDKLVATNSDGSDLVWTVAGKAADKKMSGLRCWTKDKTVSQIPNECIIKDTSKKTETIQFVGHPRHLTTVKVTVENAAKAQAEATLTLKPYFDLDSFVKVSSLVYRNGYAPGQRVLNYVTETDTEMIANLGGAETTYGAANPYGKQVFTDEELNTIDRDMYLNYVRPHMLKKDDSYYGTRASVVAAARFLILQFPYDIPYSNGSGDYKRARSHYVFSDRAEKSKLSEVGILGLNLNSNEYNTAVNHDADHIIRKGVVPWGAAFCKLGDVSCCSNTNCEKDGKKDENPDFEFSGLECSGFVTWSFRNGLLGLGDWSTMMFAKSGECKVDGKIVRNYKCKDNVNNVSNKYYWSNQNNKLTSAYAKMSRIKDGDFIALNGLTESDLKTKLKGIKAGDLLWKGTYINKAEDTYRNGHVAMIIGVKRDSKGVVTAIEVGEATGRNGNKLTKFTSLKEFATSSWGSTTTQASFIIKMDNVYNYYSDTKEITTESAKSDCPDGKKSGGNCYMYTDMYNEVFNDAIQNKKL